MNMKKKNREYNRFVRFKKRYPTLLNGLVILLITAGLIGGKTMVSVVSGKSADISSNQTVDANEGIKLIFANTEKTENETTQGASSTVKDGVQYITSTMSSGGYEPITVQQGIPVKWTLNVPSSSLNGCNNVIIIPEYDLQIRLNSGENIIEFTPDKSGIFGFSCWMGMIRSSISVVGEEGTIDPSQGDGTENLPVGCCG